MLVMGGLSLRSGAWWIFASIWKLFARRCVVCSAGAATQRILLGLPRLLGALFSCAVFNVTRFNKIAIQGTPEIAVDKEGISLSRVC